MLVIANAQPSDAAWEDYPKPTPSAFAPEEVKATRRWVEQGGALLLIADHMPLAGAASAMAGAFGFHFTDGFAIPKARVHDDGRITIGMPDIFRAADGGLAAHEITDGRIGGRVSQVATFIGQAFWADPGAEPLLVFPEGSVVLFPAKPWSFDATTPRMPAGGWLQGATRRVGAGRVAAFGEAAMFTAQIASNKKKMGLNAPGAEENARFTRNLMAWLSDVRDGSPDSATHDP